MKFFIILLLFFTTRSYGQSYAMDTVFLKDAKKNAIALYDNEMFSQSHLINGGQYNRVQKLHSDASRLEEAHPYYAFEWIAGTVLYDGDWYQGSFLYDLDQDNLILINSFLQKQLLLVKEKIEQFTLGSHRFVKLIRHRTLDDGFYDIIYDGNTDVYIQRSKKLERVVGQNVEVPYKYILTTNYFIKKNGVYHSVKSKRSVLKVLSEQETELKKFLRTQSQSFKENRAFLISEMARLYDHLQTEK